MEKMSANSHGSTTVMVAQTPHPLVPSVPRNGTPHHMSTKVLCCTFCVHILYSTNK